jgi:hypothetical protein
MSDVLPGFRLVGEDGNAYAILGRFRRCARAAGWSVEQINAVSETAKKGDYDHLLRTLMPYANDDNEEEE